MFRIAPPQSCPKSPTSFKETVHGNSPKMASSLAWLELKIAIKINVAHFIVQAKMIILRLTQPLTYTHLEGTVIMLPSML